MTLRTPGEHPATGGRRRSRLLLLGLCAVVVALVVAAFAGSSGAGVAQYTGTLYFAGSASSVSGSWQITTATPAAQGTTPVATAGVANSGGVPTGAYKYVYVTASGGARTASLASNQVSVTNAAVTVTNVPVGAEVYRAKIATGTNTASYILIGTNAGPTTTYTDTSTATSGTLLPQSDNRVALSTTGWAAFVPGVSSPSSTLMNTSVSASTPSIPSTCTGWIVDGAGSVSFAAGLWTINAQARSDSNANGAAVLTAAMWKVDDSGATVSGGTVIPPTDGGSFTFNGSAQTVSVSYTTSSATTLAANEHLCVQFWRHQTTAYSSGGATSRNIQLLAWDPNSRISAHPAPNAFASASLSSPADSSRSQTIPTLGATYSDAESDAGTLTIRLCSDSGCGTVLNNSGALAATAGATLTWTPSGPLSDGTYYWQAQAKDGTGLASSWTATRTFVIDTVAPNVSITSKPPASSNSASGSFSFSADESVTGYQCRIDGAAFAACSSPYAYSGLSDANHTFDVKATADLAGNAGAVSSYSWTVDTIAPNTAITSTPSSLSNSSSPSFVFSSTESGSSFECNLDAAGFSSCASPKTYSGLADGPHTFQVRSIDAAANADASPASYSWTVDATPPDTTIGSTKPAALTSATSATFDFSANESGSTFECSRDGAAFTACASTKSYTGLADGAHTFQVRATDTAGNTDPSPDSYSWTVDTSPPSTTIGPTKPAAKSTSATATIDFSANEAGSTFQCRLDAAAYAPCTSPATYAGLGDGTHTFSVKATDPAANVETSAATYSWEVDTLAPSTPPLASPSDGLLTNASPQLRASFSDATAGDSGSVDFRICAGAASAGAACAPVVTTLSSGSVTNGGTATVTPAPLPDGTYHWQARAQDVAGNQSGWSATRSFQIDSTQPAVPMQVSPGDDAWVRSIQLDAIFRKPAFAGTGTVEFRLCSDGLCLGVVSTGTSARLVNGATASWAPSAKRRDGLYYWQARARDEAGNESAWSAARMFHLDATPPAAPTNFNGQIGGDGLTLRWDPPNDTLDNFYIYVDGASGPSLGPVTYEYKVGPFDAADTRTFAVVAVDKAGNQSPLSKALVGVPNVVGMTLTQAEAAAKARGLDLREDASIRSVAAGAVIVSQTPAAGSVAEKGTPLRVVISGAAGSGTALTLSAHPGRVMSRAGHVVRLRLELSSAAAVQASLLRSNGRAVATRKLGQLRAGTTTVGVPLPRTLGRGSYRLVLVATTGRSRAETSVRVSCN